MFVDREINFLLVEDDQVDVKNVQRAFKKNSIENPLLIAGNGVEALSMRREECGDGAKLPYPHIILLDLNMPKMNGLEFLEELRKDPDLKPISVFVLSTSNEETDKLKAFNLNVAGYILKPLKYSEFIETIRTLDVYWNLNKFPKEIKKL